MELLPDRLDLTVEIRNTDARAVSTLTVTGQLGGRYDQVKLATGVGAGESRRALLRFDPPGPRLGMFVVALRLDYEQAPVPPATTATPLSQAAYVTVALGPAPAASLGLRVSPLALETSASIAAEITSLDGRPHRVRLRALTPRGLNAEPPAVEVAVPATGAVSAKVPLLRAGATRGTRLGVLVAAETLDGDVQQAAVQETSVEILPEPVWLQTGIKRGLAGLAALLIVWAAWAEWERRRDQPPA